jgi:hypothetical protein
MVRNASCRIAYLSTVALSTMAMTLSALAAPPLQKALNNGRPQAAADGLRSSHSFPHLDLRLPGDHAFPIFHTERSAGPRMSGDDPGFRDAATLKGAQGNASKADSLSQLGAEMQGVRPRVQEIAERFHREGLPMARLWENHSAVVSLGLNQKGKPGLWLVQKTH